MRFSFKRFSVPIPEFISRPLIGWGLGNEIKAETVILNKALGLEGEDQITEGMVKLAIKGLMFGGEVNGKAIVEIGRQKYDKIVEKIEERILAHRIMFQITREEIEEVVFEM